MHGALNIKRDDNDKSYSRGYCKLNYRPITEAGQEQGNKRNIGGMKEKQRGKNNKQKKKERKSKEAKKSMWLRCLKKD